MNAKSHVVVYEFEMGDVADPEVYLAEPVWEWQQTPEGKQAMKYADGNLYYHINPSKHGFGYTITITGEVEGKYETLYRLLKKA